jgi:hypothetical protein
LEAINVASMAFLLLLSVVNCNTVHIKTIITLDNFPLLPDNSSHEKDYITNRGKAQNDIRRAAREQHAPGGAG